MRGLCLMLLVSLAGTAAGEVLMVYSIQRHGARNVLPKTATLKESDSSGGPTLLPEGQRQAYDAGLAYRARYLDAATCAANSTCLDATVGQEGPQYGVVGTPAGTFNNFNVLARSSSLDRTIMTARSFLDAVFPPINTPTNASYLPDGQQVVPVYSLPEDGPGGTLLRAYTACPAYDARLLAWFGSEEFRGKEVESAALRAAVAAAAPALDTSLQNWWNVYDGFNVYRTYNVGTLMPPLDDAAFGEMQQLANWLETAKMRSSLTGHLLSGAQLADLLSYLAAAAAATASNIIAPVYYKLLHSSAHYNTQLGLLGALGIDQLAAAANVAWLRKIPSLAALMAFELHAESAQRPQQLAVRLVMQDGPAAPYTTIPLPCAVAGDGAEALAGAGACTLAAFQALVQPLALSGAGQWCDACDNSGMTACKLQTAVAQLEAAAATAASGGAGCGSCLSSGAVAGIAVACAAAVAVAAGAAFVVYRRRLLLRLEQARLETMHGASFSTTM